MMLQCIKSIKELLSRTDIERLVPGKYVLHGSRNPLAPHNVHIRATVSNGGGPENNTHR
ncbi:hypothetical protein QJS10_CPB04g00263 [Acorus calamus]|uniref:Uncharacterized protein n=1 Tax=Acorus calamus TaxID=4465 RepID=A0AAV9F1L0_ACOCL|nr:hypothetical protein QJS10_CPB04g00263 [Acorus calamus]